MILKLFSILLVTSAVFAYQQQENDNEVSEENIKDLLNSYSTDNDDEPENEDEKSLNQLVEKYEAGQLQDSEEVALKDLLEKYHLESLADNDEEEDFADNDDSHKELVDEDENDETDKDYKNALIDPSLNKDGSTIESDEIELLDEDEDLDEADIDALMGMRSKDPKALWGWRAPRFRLPRIRLPRLRFPRFRFPRIRLPRIRIRLPRIRLPRIRFPRFRFPRIRFPRIRFRKIRFRRIKLPGWLTIRRPGPKQPHNPCPFKGENIVSAIEGIRCDSHWKTIFENEHMKKMVDTPAFINICKVQTVCLGCMNTMPWNKAQCNNKLKATLRNVCAEIADGDPDTLAWCNGKVDEIIKYENAKQAPRPLYYCKCGADVTDIGNPAKN